jgi:hypothetical protein
VAYRPGMAKSAPTSDKTPSKAGAKAGTTGDWRVATISRFRKCIEQAAPGVTEERKWAKASNPDGVPTWYKDGLICTGETYKDHVKATFARGGSLKDPARLFKPGTEGAVRRAVDLYEGDTLDEKAFKALVRDAVALNQQKAAARRK